MEDDFDGSLGSGESDIDDNNLCNALVLCGPHGVGKTSMVYAVAKELGFKVSLLLYIYYSIDKYNKLRCKSTTNPVPVLRIAASHGFSKLTKNVIRSSHGHSTPSLKISCKSVQPFSRNLANKERKIHTNKEIDRKHYPVPRSIGDG